MPRKSDSSIVYTLSVGNTTTRLLAWNERVVARLQWDTARVPSKLTRLLLELNLQGPVIVSSVVPAARNRTVALLKKHGADIFVFRKDLKPRIQIVPSPALRVGDDRIAAALGALSIDSTRPWVVVDFGTATTINAITPGKVGKPPRFEGGLILPSPHISLLALAQHTAQLPSLQDWKPNRDSKIISIARNTRDAMRWGVWQAHVAATIALAKAQLAALGARAKLAVTGGDADYLTRQFIAAFPAARVVASADLVHLGLYQTWRERAR